jgi:deoxyribodipyrimidine photo-lyase
MFRKSLYWFTQDLRVNDNHALTIAQESDALLCVYIIDPRWFKAKRWQQTSMGCHRWWFVQESISDLANSLEAFGQRLNVYYGQPDEVIQKLCHTYSINHILCTRRPGSDEQATISAIHDALPSVKLELIDQYTLFDADNLPIPIEELPASFTPFRKIVEPKVIRNIVTTPQILPLMPRLFALPSIQRPDWIPAPKSSLGLFRGGETKALQHLNAYFSGELPKHYKNVRNELDGWDNSSKFSPWLNQGCLSARQVKSSLEEYELKNGSNDSTQWLYVELLWREYFQWLHFKIGSQLFQFKGAAKTAPLTSYYAERYKKWCHGQTPYPLVNACMNELKTTGYLSNRGRQIVASCLVNELSVDWRYGAAWFEHQLVDYDVAVNWGNWQYIAGVGADPRGGRHFNLEKQTSLYDSNGVYRKKWDGQAVGPLDSVDAADWPIMPPDQY